MKDFLRRIFSGEPQPAPQPVASSRAKLDIHEFGHGLVSIDSLDFIGHSSVSPKGRYRLIWADRHPDGTRGGYREEGHGTWALLESDRIILEGRLERPQDGHVADNGNFILSDWMFGDGLKGRLHGFRADGGSLFEREFVANMASSGLSEDGRFAICQTANAPGSPDSCRYFLFDVEQGKEIASWEQETGWADGYEFDTEARRVFLGKSGEARVAYDFVGKMVDREGWQARRIAAGDLSVIRTALEDAGQDPSTELRDALFAGLDVAAKGDDIWTQAKALRIRGEMQEQAGEVALAIDAYEQALAIDPQVGVARRLGKLQRSTRPADKGAKPAKVSRYQKQAERLGIRHEVVELEQDGAKQWRFDGSSAVSSVEEAALDHYRADGWDGAAAEGGLILTLIKAASFSAVPKRNADTFVEALYAQNVAFDEDRFEPRKMIEAIARSTRGQIEANWKIIAATAGNSPAFYPSVRREHVLGLYENLRPERLVEIARVFATAAYDLRAGWPDLTLWKNGSVKFVEIKAPGDSMHAKQARLISTLLLPLGCETVLAEIKAK
ncbi:MAG: VRR-NUC domain-containing protein [Rhodobacteraceae bacterium]|nr:VRR-NUC domain-containing protein [Paracoccaceae bacterium]